MEVQRSRETLKRNYHEAPYLGPSTSAFSNYEILDLETASRNHINEADIEDETLYNIMDEITDKDTEDRNPQENGIVLQIVNDKGNLMAKQVSKKSTKEGPMENQTVDLEINETDKFQCQICHNFFIKLSDLIQHVKDVHKTLPPEYEDLLNKQLFAIEKIKRTAHELINLQKFEAVETLLKTSRKSLNSFKMDIFGKGDTNIFQFYVTLVYEQIYQYLNDRKNSEHAKSVTKKENSPKESISKSKKSKKNNKTNSAKGKHKKTKHKSTNVEFSSDDEISLRDSLLKSQGIKVQSPCETSEKPRDSGEELYLQFYAVPYKLNGQLISLFEMESLRNAVKSMWNGIRVDLSNFSDILIKRYERECNEILPDNALFSGYALRENTSILTESKPLTDVFDENLLLNDGIQTHKSKSKRTGDKSCNSIKENTNDDVLAEIHIESNKSEAGNTDIFNQFPPLSDSEDSYDDGFEKATNFLTNIPQQKKQKEVNVYDECDVCREMCKTKKALIQHINQHHNDLWRIYVCKICGDKVFPRSKLWEHFKTHTDKVLYECEFCCDTFPSVREKSQHIKKNHNVDEPVCFLCKVQLVDLNELQTHFSQEHSLDKSPGPEPEVAVTSPTCKVCNRKFTSSGRLSQHLAAAHQDKKTKKK